MAGQMMGGHVGTKAPQRSRPRRGDGASTRTQILEAAGLVFAEKGFDRATAKEIAERARANAAGVNYYYGGIEGLYEEVLLEAHHRLVDYQALAATVAGADDPTLKLRGLIELMLEAALGPVSSSWAVRVIGREILSPTPHADVLRRKEIEPKKSLVFGVISELLGVGADEPSVSRACFSIVAPCVMLLLADRSMITSLFPELGPTGDTQALSEHMVRFALAGLAAQARRGSAGNTDNAVEEHL